MTQASNVSSIPWFPTDFIFACIDNAGEAQAAREALRHAGFHPNDVTLLSGAQALATIDAACHQCNLVLRTLRFLWRFLTDEGVLEQEYESEALAGHSLMAVHVPEDHQPETACHILREHGAHRVEYWGHAGTITQVCG